MNKGEFIKAIAEKAELTHKQADEAYAAFVDTVEEELKKGEKVQLIGFGTFELKHKPERQGVNPATGDKITIAESYTPKLKVGKSFKEKFNN